MLKKILTSLDGLHEELQKLYTKKDDGKFHLALEDDDAEPLRRAKEHEVGLRQIAERDLAARTQELNAAQARVEELTRAQSKSVADVRAELEADYGKRMKDMEEKHARESGALSGTIKDIFVNDVALKISKEIAVDDGAAELLSQLIRNRLQVEMVDGKPITRVMSPDGKATALTPDQLRDEYFTNEKYASIMRATGASGGGATAGSGKGGGATYKTLDDLNSDQRTKMQKDNPAEWARLVAEKRASVGQ